MKGIELIPHLTDEQKKLLEQSALQYKRFARITIEVVSVNWLPLSKHPDSDFSTKDHVVVVKVKQQENPSGKYLTASELNQRAQEVFEGIVPVGSELQIKAVPYKFLEVVDLSYIEQKKTELGLTDTDISRLLDIRKENLSRLFSEARGLTKWHQAAFYYLFKSLENK
jgi:hypothetical protein